jgi:guanylate kinase
MKSQKAIIFVGPAGAGKNTILNHLHEVRNDLEYLVSATTRPPREGEVEGVNYHFVSVEQFENMIAEGKFVEYEQVHPGRYYGTLWSEFERIWGKGKIATGDLEVLGAINVKKEFGDKLLTVFIKPPSFEEIERRMRIRGSEDEATLKTRLERAKMEMDMQKRFDVVLENDDLYTALKNAEKISEDFISS